VAFAPEPQFAHDRIPKIGVLVTNLGTPAEATPAAVRRYLAEFLSDPRVVEIPRVFWKPILHGVVLRVRPKISALKYGAVWTPDGSPLMVHSRTQQVLLKGYLGERLKAAGLPADHCVVELGMRYGKPGIGEALDKLREADCERILVLPLYPQYASSTTASTFDAVGQHMARMRRVPALRFVDGFHDEPGYILAMAQTVNDYWKKNGRPDQLILSFHGLPKRSLTAGDPYHCLCHATGRLLARELGLESNQWQLTFQSRFGKAEWLQPYTAPTLAALGKAGVGRVDVFCPGFVADCLETLEEIGIEGRASFISAGGRELHSIPCLNGSPRFIAALAEVVMRNLGGWLAAPTDRDARETTLARAKALGASR
jgi:ferrochelatase